MTEGWSVSTLRCRVTLATPQSNQNSPKEHLGYPAPSHFAFTNRCDGGANDNTTSRDCFLFLLYLLQCYTANLNYHRRDADTLSSCPASLCRRKRGAFHPIVATSSVLTYQHDYPPTRKRRLVGCLSFMGPGETRRYAAIVYQKLLFNKKYQRNKILIKNQSL